MVQRGMAGVAAVLVAGAMLAAMLPGAAQAASIGLQFVNGNKNPTYNLETQGYTAGVSAVAQNNWNSLVASGTSLTDMHDSSGTTISGCNVTISSGAYYSAGGGFADSGNTSLAISTYLAAFGGNPSAVFTGIPYAQYDVYVYGMNDNAPASDRHTSIYDGTTYSSFLATNAAVGGVWTLATGTWDGTGTPPVEDVATYVLFSGKSGSSLTISWKSYGNSGVNGIQIVQVPEPASMALLSAGAVAMLARRRRRRA